MRDFHAAAARQALGRRHHLRPHGRGFLYLALVLDVFSRKVAGWAMLRHLETELVTSARGRSSRDAGVPASAIHANSRG